MGMKEFAQKAANRMKQLFKLESSIQYPEPYQTVQKQKNINPQFEQLHNTSSNTEKEISTEKAKHFKLAEDVVEFLAEHDPAFGYEPTTEGLRNKQEYVNTVFQAVQKDDVGYINRVNTLQTEMQQNTPSPKMAQPQVEPLSMEF